MDEARAREGLVHLQAAALEVIAACRAFLDVAEQIARDPAAVGHMAQAAAGVVRAAQEAAGPRAGAAGDAAGGAGDDEGEPPGVTRIRLS